MTTIKIYIRGTRKGLNNSRRRQQRFQAAQPETPLFAFDMFGVPIVDYLYLFMWPKNFLYLYLHHLY